MTTPYNSHSSAISAMNNLIELGRDAYHWAQANGATYSEAAERFKVDANSIHSYRQYRKLPKLRTK